MRKLLLLLTLICGSARATDIITATVTITNVSNTTNGIITVNGTTRTWVTNVTSASTQIAVAGTTNAAGSNLFTAYISFSQSIPAILRSSNVVTFTALPGAALTVTTATNWASVVLSTNTIVPMMVLRVPFSALGLYERTNAENGLVDLLNDGAMGSNIFKLNALAFSNFVPTALSNSVAGLSNSVVTTSNSFVRFTNFLYTNIITIVSNTTASWPAAPTRPGDAVIVSSNGYPYILLSTNSATWNFTNRLGWP